MIQTLLVLVGILGLLIGSFLNVVIWRLPRGESLSHPGSTCPNCQQPIRWFDNIPVLSWLLLRGRCRACAEPIALRYPLVEAATGLLFILVALMVGFEAPRVWALPAFLYLAAISVALALIDIDTHRLPNRIVLPSYAVGLALLALPTAASGDWTQLLRALAGAAALFAFYLVLALAVPRGMGFGDVKLAGVLGLYLGWLGWGWLAIGAFAAFFLGGVFSIALLISRKARRESGIPFGPWMLAGAGVGVFFGEDLADSYLALVGLK
ncbi:MAG TPA: prepilin peptidase [Marisediminicola sp.]|jgi:leader peptidase (prepilin peptidase)/N-methyltransferase|nr:prepilin peptidase [Marisediminicola sp.]